MKQSLLVFDSISSIVPQTYRRGDAFPAGTVHLELEPHLRWLENEGHWRPVYGADYFPVDFVIAHLRETYAQSALDIPAFSLYAEENTYSLAYAKFEASARRALIEAGLAEERPFRSPEGRVDKRLWVSRHTLYTIMAAMARSIGEESLEPDIFPARYIPSTDAEEYFALAYDAPISGDLATGEMSLEYRRKWTIARGHQIMPIRARCLQLLLRGFIPLPGPTVPLEDVITFREAYRPELIAFRESINRLLSDITVSDDPVAAIQDARSHIEAKLVDLERAARAKRFQLVTSTALLVTGVVASRTFHDASIQWSLGVLGGVLAANISTRMVSRPDKDEVGYLIRAKSLTELSAGSCQKELH